MIAAGCADAPASVSVLRQRESVLGADVVARLYPEVADGVDGVLATRRRRDAIGEGPELAVVSADLEALHRARIAFRLGRDDVAPRHVGADERRFAGCLCIQERQLPTRLGQHSRNVASGLLTKEEIVILAR